MVHDETVEKALYEQSFIAFLKDINERVSPQPNDDNNNKNDDDNSKGLNDNNNNINSKEILLTETTNSNVTNNNTKKIKVASMLWNRLV